MACCARPNRGIMVSKHQLALCGLICVAFLSLVFCLGLTILGSIHLNNREWLKGSCRVHAGSDLKCDKASGRNSRAYPLLREAYMYHASVGNVSCQLMLDGERKIEKCYERAEELVATPSQEVPCHVDTVLLPDGAGIGPLDFARSGVDGRRTCWESPASATDPYTSNAVIFVIVGPIFIIPCYCMLHLGIRTWCREVSTFRAKMKNPVIRA